MFKIKFTWAAYVLLLSSVTIADKQSVVAITDFKYAGIDEKMSHLFVEKVGSDLSSNERLNVIVHSEVKSVLVEVGLATEPCVTSACLIEAGDMMEISHIITGKVTKKGSIIAAEAKVIDVKSSKVQKVRTALCWRCSEQDLLRKIAGTLSATISATIQGSSNLKSNLKNTPKVSSRESPGFWSSKWTYIGLGTIATGSVATYFLIKKPEDKPIPALLAQ